jgi:hypothetical protein
MAPGVPGRARSMDLSMDGRPMNTCSTQAHKRLSNTFSAQHKKRTLKRAANLWTHSLQLSELLRNFRHCFLGKSACSACKLNVYCLSTYVVTTSTYLRVAGTTILQQSQQI